MLVETKIYLFRELLRETKFDKTKENIKPSDHLTWMMLKPRFIISQVIITLNSFLGFFKSCVRVFLIVCLLA